ncbi:flippase [Haloimpatiens sp. FM7330]|uniref:flippase n=1 Tax=Haloimpatiens sp. FM7330 TaxID=3298610 RepID=UPI003633B6EB
MVKNFLSVGFANIVSQLMAFFVIAYYARIIGKVEFGKVSLAQSILMYFTMITLFGFQTYGTREISRNRKNTERLVGDIVSLRLIIASICFCIVCVIAVFANKGVEFRNLLILYGLTVFPLSFNIDWFFSGIQEMHHNALYNIIRNFVPFVLIMLLFKNKNRIYYIPIFTSIGLLFAVLYQSYIYKSKQKLNYNLGIHKKVMLNYIKIASPFLISSLLSMINCNMDSIIIGFLRSDAELGIYSSAYKIIFFLTNLIAVVFTPVFPVMIQYYNYNDKSYLNKLMDNVSKIVIMLAVPICVGGILLSKEIIILIFKQEYVSAHVPLSILLIYVLVLFMRETYGYALNAWNMEREYLKTVIISSMTNVVLNLILIPLYGIVAAAVTTVISEILNYLFMQRYAFKVVKTNYMKNIIRVIMPTFIMVIGIIVMKLLNIHVIIDIVVSIIVYFSSIVIFKYMTLDEVKKFLKKKSGI